MKDYREEIKKIGARYAEAGDDWDEALLAGNPQVGIVTAEEALGLADWLDDEADATWGADDRHHRMADDIRATVLQAEIVSVRYDGDGTKFEDAEGVNIADACINAGADVEYGAPTGERRPDGSYVYVRCAASEHVSDDPVRYVFPDGSAIVLAGNGWDIEGPAPFSWSC